MSRCEECIYFKPGWNNSLGVCKRMKCWTAPEWYCDKCERKNKDEVRERI